MSACVDVAELLAAIAAGIPPLPGALCRGNGDLFDPYDREVEELEDWRYRRESALRTCGRCPELAACSEWLESIDPELQPLGVVAGRVVRRRDLAVWVRSA